MTAAIDYSPKGRSRTRYYNPPWLGEITPKSGTISYRILDLLRQEAPEGLTIAQLARRLRLDKVQVKNALTSLQHPRKRAVLVVRKSDKSNVKFAADRILHHLLWGEMDQAHLTYEWMLDQLDCDPDLAKWIAEEVAARTKVNGFEILAPEIGEQEAIRICAFAAGFMNGLFHRHDFNATARPRGREVSIFFGADVINLEQYRNRKALSLLEGDTGSKLEGLLMLLAGLRRKE